ncbi:hypothetical protein Q0601_20025 [Paracoccus onubensis]|uniref:hypothetical protein n=1 Tax=Paracoccus onubensis TaxID=1675788 RepID=UPI0027311847|nr:hypothetical protein [Paracoccus onubensis]MDP0929479.1 hypothetical protein [Paracoccus onubensis]
MEKLINEIRKKNDEWGDSHRMEATGDISGQILMIDEKTYRSLSQQMRDYYTIVSTWENGLLGKTSYPPSQLKELYKQDDVKEVINLIAENYRPVPPSDNSDWNRTAIFAKEQGGLGVTFYWWRNANDDEPAIISISGGDVKIFADLLEYLKYLAYNEFSEAGDAIYSDLERERGTLSD